LAYLGLMAPKEISPWRGGAVKLRGPWAQSRAKRLDSSSEWLVIRDQGGGEGGGEVGQRGRVVPARGEAEDAFVAEPQVEEAEGVGAVGGEEGLRGHREAGDVERVVGEFSAEAEARVEGFEVRVRIWHRRRRVVGVVLEYRVAVTCS
jgi:hypothetical protein